MRDDVERDLKSRDMRGLRGDMRPDSREGRPDSRDLRSDPRDRDARDLSRSDRGDGREVRERRDGRGPRESRHDSRERRDALIGDRDRDVAERDSLRDRDREGRAVRDHRYLEGWGSDDNRSMYFMI